ncbi:MAG: hypothetical protein IK097_08015 [Clostridia bacterium]|nr:hypothetical protein [Clostridia bacterium]
MRKAGIKTDTVSSRRKPIIAAVCIGAPLLILLVLFLIFGKSAVTNYAVRCMNGGNYDTARAISHMIGGEKGGILRDYIDLRSDINAEYSTQLASFDIAKASSWRDRAESVNERAKERLAPLVKESDTLYKKLYSLCQLEREYENMRDDILEMMSVFSEINRLYTPDESGSKPAFTISEENEKIMQWEEICRILGEFESSVPGGDSIYLLSYLISETYAECEDIRNQLLELGEKGYSDDDYIKVSGDGRKVFPDIAGSSGVSVSVERKEQYEEYMFTDICRALTRTLAGYYTGISDEE